MTVTFRGENGYAKYHGQKVTSIEVNTNEPYVEFGLYGVAENGFELDTASASAGTLVRAENVFILSDFDEDVTVDFTTRYRTMQVNFVISPNANAMYVDTPVSVTWGQPVPVPETRRVGSHVSNWYTDAAYTQVYDFSTPVTTNLTLYGKWETNVYTVTYIVDGEVYYSTQVDHGEYVTNPKNPTKNNYVFDGWYTDEACTQLFDRNQSIKADVTVYAAWAEAKLNYVYLDGKNGDDSNSGMTASYGVKTFARAKELLADSAYKVIYITSMVTVGDTQVWDLSEYPDAVVTRAEGYKSSYMFWVNATGNLTLQNICIDGGAQRWAAEDGTPFSSYIVGNCTSGKLTLNAGTEICNTVTTSSNILFLHNADFTMNDGASIHDNTCKTATIGLSTTKGGSSIVLNGGEIHHNTVTYAAKANVSVLSVPAGAISLSGSSTKGFTTFTMNGGKIYANNAAAEGSLKGVGAIYVGQYVNAEFKGGEITGNAGATAGAILLQSGSATKPSSCTLENGRIFGNTATAGAEYQIYAHGSLILANQSMVESEILLMNSTARLPVLVTSALKQPLRLKLEAQVYMNKIVGGSGYTLTEADLANIELTEPLDSHYKLSVDTETNTVFLNASRVVGTIVYLAATGSDANDGKTAETAVLTFARAKELLIERQSATGDNIISIPSASAGSSPKCLVVRSDETWSLKGIPNAYVMLENDTNTSGNLVEVLNCTLTLEDITFDGNRYYQLKGKYATAIRGDWSDGQKAQIVVKSGTVFRDFDDDAIYAYGSIVTIEDGAVFENIRKGSAVFATGSVQKTDDKSSEVIVNGGTFRNNLYSCLSILGQSKLTVNGGLFENNVVSNTKGGAVILGDSAGAEITVNGGIYRNNALTAETGTMSIGTVLLATNGCKVTVTGGEFYGNTCASAENGNGFACSGTNAADITLKLKAGTNMTNAPFFWNTPSKTACLNIASALPGAMKIAFRSAPAAGTVVAAGADYTLTENDLNNLTSLTEGVRFALVNGQIVTAE